jgi:hypothetical protein
MFVFMSKIKTNTRYTNSTLSARYKGYKNLISKIDNELSKIEYYLIELQKNEIKSGSIYLSIRDGEPVFAVNQNWNTSTNKFFVKYFYKNIIQHVKNKFIFLKYKTELTQILKRAENLFLLRKEIISKFNGNNIYKKFEVLMN